ncbi:MAG: LLM class F420-dependent oxidoreductase [Chloroflexi bacterium]|nr:LLM class F420-dependent oxidoreductase [Chloroflexota bacterium]MDA1003877.1 LLM class F420-dependent oxidoreductase [Chloroflexota bacterium]
MRVAVGLAGTEPGDWEGAATFAAEAERLGAHSVWSSEAWGFDAVSPLAFVAARTRAIRLGTGIMQIGARTPAMVAMTALTMQSVSGGRFILGLGTSGPQVIEGWHGVPFDRPVRRTRELIEIVRTVTRGDRLNYDGEVYRLPLPGAPGAPGRGIRTSAPVTEVPIYVAALGPRNLELTGELCDGWIGTSFIPETAEVFLTHIRAGAARTGRTLDALDLQVPVAVEFTDDVDEVARRHARGYAFTFGAMGSRSQNFYKDAFARQGFADEANEIQRLWLEGKRDEAADRVPIEIALKTNLLGTPDMIRARLRVYRDAGVNTLRAGLRGSTIDERLEQLERLLALIAEVDAEG